MKESLPIDAALPEVLSALRRGPAVVLEAPPGAGKTTRVPPALLNLVQGEVVVLEPRRIAARAAARRVASELDDPDLVGWKIRFDQSGSARTRLWYVTEGILARRLLADPQLAGVGAVVLDEFHERHLPGDLSLALAQRLLPRLKLVVMSATLDAAPLAEHLRAPSVRSEGQRHPVEIEHLEKPDDRRLGDQIAAAVRRLTVPGTDGDVLVFLPGASEIRHAAEACAELARHRDLLLLPLHGDLPAEEQDRALEPARQRKVILATNVAETSITVPGVTAVIDSGLARIAAHSPWSGLPSLTVAKISRASAIQRAGRAGRLAPGRALRLYTRHDFESRPDHHPPEIERLDLAATVLELRAANLDPEALPWLDPPPPAALQAADRLLRRLGALDDAGRATDLGRACARLPLHPRLSRLIVEAARHGYVEDGCALAAALSERRATEPMEMSALLGARRDARLERQLLRAAPRNAARSGSRDDAIHLAALKAFADRVAKRRGDDVLLASGGAAQLPIELRALPDLMVAIDAEERRAAGRTRVMVRIASPVQPEWLLDGDATREETQLVWEPARRRVEQVSRLLYDQLVLEESRRPAPPSPEATRLLLEHATLDAGRLSRLRARTALVARHCPEAGIEPLTNERIEAQLALAASGCTSLEELESIDVLAALTPKELDRLAPEHVVLPAGRRLTVEYVEGQPPAVRSRLQDFFGLDRGPSICNGRLPLTLHLLAPSGRVQQITQDLEGFWERHYPDIRRELMRRYPKHAWPEDGATARPPSVNRRP
ncbi:MAG TPA: ATP-dependent helicase HrpB [Myxococcales bacterium]|nr:ATP-dependent helicase HrpB [Myxococcales bacterium]